MERESQFLSGICLTLEITGIYSDLHAKFVKEREGLKHDVS